MKKEVFQGSKKYLCGFIGLSLLYYFLCFLTRGEIIQYIFHPADYDTYMDFFHSVNNTRFGNPYNNLSNYPPLALLFYRVMFHIIPNDLLGENGFDLRITQMGQMSLVFYYVGCLSAISFLIEKLSRLDRNETNLIKVSFLVSAPVIFTIERGNLILFVLVCSMFYVSNYESRKWYVRELAYISLAIASAMKIYPAILGLFLISPQKVWTTLRTILYGILFFFLPFAFYGGWSGLATMIKALMLTTSDSKGYGINVSAYNICSLYFELLNLNVQSIIIFIITFLIFGICIYVFWTSKDKFYKYLTISLMIILIPKTSYYYSCIFLIFPFIEFVNRINDSDLYEKICGALLLIIMVPWPFGFIKRVSEGAILPTSWGMLLQYTALICLPFVALGKLVKIKRRGGNSMDLATVDNLPLKA